MLFLFQGCIGLSFKNWTGLQDLQEKGFNKANSSA